MTAERLMPHAMRYGVLVARGPLRTEMGTKACGPTDRVQDLCAVLVAASVMGKIDMREGTA